MSINYSNTMLLYHNQPKAFTSKKSQNKVSFKGRPWELPYLPVNNSRDAITLYNYLKVGNYLDSADDDVSFENKSIRKTNLGFLDAIKTQKDKKEFIDYYKNLTGFPDLAKVSRNIENEFVSAIYKSSNNIQGGECIAAGYDGTCSVGKRRAFPGSDLDKSFIILKGSEDKNPEKDKQIVNQFKSNMWNNVDQRILSFNHDISFPTIFTANQIKETLKDIDNKTSYMFFDKKELNKIMDEEYVNLEKASTFNLKISKAFPTDDGNKKNIMTKTDVKNFGYFIEPVRDGKYLISTPAFYNLKEEIGDSQFYQYSNVAQTRAMKKAVNEGRENKNKIRMRENMEAKFNSLDTDEQYNFIKTLIKYSCEDNTEYPKYFTNDRNVKDAYKPVLNMLTCGDKDHYNRPEFYKGYKRLDMKYSTNDTVSLYRGYADNVLWIDSNKSDAIKQTCRHINKIKECELFKNVDKIQCISPDEYIAHFYPTQYKTKDLKTIYERNLNNEN